MENMSFETGLDAAGDHRKQLDIWLKYLEQNEVTRKKELEEKHKKLEEYDKLKEQITELTKKLEKNVFIPVGRMAFLPGKLDRTNEFYTVIGDNHFVKKSSFRTVELLNRRQKIIQDQIKKLDEELNLVKQRKEFAEQLGQVTSTDEVEIREPYIEPEEEKQEEKQEESLEQPNKLVGKPETVADSDYEALLRRLDELEALEEEELDSDDASDNEVGEEEIKYEKIFEEQLKKDGKKAVVKKGVRFNHDTLGPANSSPLIQEVVELPQPILKHTDHVPRVDQQAIEAMNKRDQTLILPESKVAFKGTIVERDPLIALKDIPQQSSTSQKQSKFKSQRNKK